MDSRDRVYIQYMDSLHLAFAGESIEALEKLIMDIPKQYDKNRMSVDHYVALMNCARVYLRILKENNLK